MNTYTDTIQYLYQRLPMFTRVGPAAYKTGLGNILELCEHLGSPQNKYKTIHVAGTNGKGSTSNMLAAILQTAGYKTGLYTSPHLKDFRERIRINGAMISEQDVVSFVCEHRPYIEKLEASFFEVTTALAFAHFAGQHVDVAVIETGLGGRLDSTNIISPDLSIITNISWDHADLLGDTLEKIATEKAGIIKPQIPILITEHQREIDHIFIQKAKSGDSPILFANDTYQAIEYKQKNHVASFTYMHHPEVVCIESDLTGHYQLKNIAGVLLACDVLKEYGYIINDEDLFKALRNVKTITGFKGRWDVLQKAPLVIADIAHNAAGLKETLEQLEQLNAQLHFVIGFVKDKDLTKVLKLFPKQAKYYFCKPEIARGLDIETLMQKANEHQLIGTAYESVTTAYTAAIKNAAVDDIIYVGGSTFVVAEVI